MGRGNRVNRVMSLNRPISRGAAGKNPVGHVGKIYTLLTQHIAGEPARRVEGIAEAYVWLCSEIGRPIEAPLAAAVQVLLQDSLADVAPVVQAIVAHELATIPAFT